MLNCTTLFVQKHVKSSLGRIPYFSKNTQCIVHLRVQSLVIRQCSVSCTAC
jgi:hypothetical protein